MVPGYRSDSLRAVSISISGWAIPNPSYIYKLIISIWRGIAVPLPAL
jgi:hypothetical protein